MITRAERFRCIELASELATTGDQTEVFTLALALEHYVEFADPATAILMLSGKLPQKTATVYEFGPVSSKLHGGLIPIVADESREFLGVDPEPDEVMIGDTVYAAVPVVPDDDYSWPPRASRSHLLADPEPSDV